jgi:hypothetical protein
MWANVSFIFCGSTGAGGLVGAGVVGIAFGGAGVVATGFGVATGAGVVTFGGAGVGVASLAHARDRGITNNTATTNSKNLLQVRIYFSPPFLKHLYMQE